MADRSPKDTVDELKTMVVDYAKQETLEPLRHLGMWSGFGAAGAICFGIGAFLLGLGMLRGIQEADWAVGDGNFTWLPYLLVAFTLFALIGLCLWAMGRRPDWLEEGTDG